MTIPFKETNVGEVNNVSDVLKAFQTYGKNLLSFAVNFKLNYELLPEHEKANIRRNLGDLLYVGAAIIGAIAITGMGGDDDESIIYNLMLYHADRLASEAASFTPFGAYAEGKNYGLALLLLDKLLMIYLVLLLWLLDSLSKKILLRNILLVDIKV